MLVSLKKRVVFLAMPKCASTSVESILMPHSQIIISGHPNIKHMNYQRYVDRVRPMIASTGVKDITTFCLFREPLEWLQSWYSYRAREELSNPRHPRHKNYTGNISFQEFVNSYVNGENVSYAKLGRQSNFVSDKNGEVAVDKIFRLDKMDSLTEFLESKIGEKVTIPKKNSSDRKLSFFLDDSVKKKAIEFLSREYEIYEAL